MPIFSRSTTTAGAGKRCPDVEAGTDEDDAGPFAAAAAANTDAETGSRKAAAVAAAT